jgi:H+-transporting ATPase
MTGDGVNDAPALKQASVGIAVADATDAARSAAALVLTEQGLGVIIRGVEEARRIFERMTGYATYRITETIRLLLFLTLSLVIFNFYPVTTLMIVLLAILNDIPIMVIAWDNTPTSERPVRWGMPRVLTTATALGVAGVVASFALFYYLHQYTHLPKSHVQTLMFLKLLVPGHMTLYLTRSPGWFWQRPWPSWKLVLALEATQALGTLAAVFGFLMHPVSWKWGAIVWAYAFAWMFLLDAVKVGTRALWRRMKPSQ